MLRKHWKRICYCDCWSVGSVLKVCKVSNCMILIITFTTYTCVQYFKLGTKINAQKYLVYEQKSRAFKFCPRVCLSQDHPSLSVAMTRSIRLLLQPIRIDLNNGVNDHGRSRFRKGKIKINTLAISLENLRYIRWYIY